MAAADDYATYQVSPPGPCRRAAAVTPNDGTDLANVTRALYVGGAGAVALVTEGGDAVTLSAVPAGTLLPAPDLRRADQEHGHHGGPDHCPVVVRGAGMADELHQDAAGQVAGPAAVAAAKDCRPLCRHCLRVPVNRPRGLCWRCYYAPGVRAQYPVVSKYALASPVGKPRRRRPLPAGPTTARPGSEEKVSVMAERAARGEQLFHPEDAGLWKPREGKRVYRCHLKELAG